MGLDQIYFVESITNQYNIIYRAKLGKEMNGKDFVKLCFEEKENSLKQYFDDSYKTDVGKRINTLIESGANKEELYELINLILKETYYAILLALDGEASLGGKQLSYELLNQDGNVINQCGEIEAEAYRYFMEE